MGKDVSNVLSESEVLEHKELQYLLKQAFNVQKQILTWRSWKVSSETINSVLEKVLNAVKWDFWATNRQRIVAIETYLSILCEFEKRIKRLLKANPLIAPRSKRFESEFNETLLQNFTHEVFESFVTLEALDEDNLYYLKELDVVCHCLLSFLFSLDGSDQKNKKYQQNCSYVDYLCADCSRNSHVVVKSPEYYVPILMREIDLFKATTKENQLKQLDEYIVKTNHYLEELQERLWILSSSESNKEGLTLPANVQEIIADSELTYFKNWLLVDKENFLETKKELFIVSSKLNAAKVLKQYITFL